MFYQHNTSMYIWKPLVKFYWSHLNKFPSKFLALYNIIRSHRSAQNSTFFGCSIYEYCFVHVYFWQRRFIFDDFKTTRQSYILQVNIKLNILKSIACLFLDIVARYIQFGVLQGRQCIQKYIYIYSTFNALMSSVHLYM